MLSQKANFNITVCVSRLLSAKLTTKNKKTKPKKTSALRSVFAELPAWEFFRVNKVLCIHFTKVYKCLTYSFSSLPSTTRS